jgi:sugar-specific transcriptional regulator TrmB
MAASDIAGVLRDLDLSDKEIALYLLLLQVGTAPASTLGERADIQRSTAQYTCQQLEKRGIVRMVQKGNTYLYTAESPEKLLLLLQKQQRDLQAKGERVERIIGELKAMQNPLGVMPRVQFYEGKEGVEELYDKILQLEKPIDSFEDKGDMVAFIPEKVDTFIKTRVDKQIWNRVICPSATPINQDDSRAFRKVRTLPVAQFPFSCDVKICGDQVSIFSFEKNTAVGIAIQHRDIANNFRLLFEQMWQMLGQV